MKRDLLAVDATARVERLEAELGALRCSLQLSATASVKWPVLPKIDVGPRATYDLADQMPVCRRSCHTGVR
jgi:hypothetical protein